jgi:CRP-like cAMP-binding protein
MALISRAPRTATVTSTRNTLFLVLTERQFWELLEQVPELQLRVIRALGDRLQSLAE